MTAANCIIKPLTKLREGVDCPSMPLHAPHQLPSQIPTDCLLARISSRFKTARLPNIHHRCFAYQENMHTKGPVPQAHDGSALRIGIVHARWNDTIIEPLLAGAKAKLKECGVKESNVVVQTVPGAWELPMAVQRCASPVPFPICVTSASPCP